MKKLKRLILGIICSLALVLLPSCGNRNAEPDVAMIKIIPSATEVEIDGTINFNAVVLPTGTEVELEWSSSNTAVGTVVNGVLTAKEAGTTDVYAYYNEVKSEAVTITVKAKPVHEHSWKTEVIKEPTCLEEGLAKKTCLTCNEFIEEAIPATGHADCSSCSWKKDTNEHYHICQLCGTKVDAAEHTYGEAVINPEAGHASNGLKTYTCTVCGATKTEEIPAIGHDINLEWSHDDEYHWHHCSCGEDLDKVAHSWGEGVVTTEPGHLTTGIRTYTCECGATKEEIIPAEGHSQKTSASTYTSTFYYENDEKTYDPLTTAEAILAGMTTDAEVKPTLSNIVGVYGFANGGSGDAAFFEKDVLKLGSGKVAGTITLTYPENVKIEKVVISGINQKATSALTINGVKLGTTTTIAKNPAYETITFEIEATNVLNLSVAQGLPFVIHSLQVVTVGEPVWNITNKVDPTCEVAGGYDRQAVCGVCNETYGEVEHITIDALGHEYGELIEEIPATCTKTGMKAHYICATCGEYFDANKNKTTQEALVISCDGVEHTHEPVAEVPATCTEDGVKAHYICSNCDQLFVLEGETYVEVTLADLKIEKIGHAINNETKTPFLGEDGNWYYKSVCIHEGCEEEVTEAATDIVAQIGTTPYKTIQEAVAALPVNGSEPTTIKLVQNIVADGVDFGSELNRTSVNVIIDFNGYSYTLDGTMVGSTGTKTNGLRFLKGSTVVLKNGSILLTSEEGHTTAKMVIQNYADLTLDHMVVNATTSLVPATGKPYGWYAVSNNYGRCAIINGSEIIANKDYQAFDVCYQDDVTSYVDGLTVTVDATSKVTGIVEYESSLGSADWATKAILDLSTAKVENLEITIVSTTADLNKALLGIKLPEGYDSLYNGKFHTHDKPASGGVATWDAVAGYENSTAYETVDLSIASISFSKGTNNNPPKYFSSGTAGRFYAGNTFTVTSAGTITKVTITYGTGGNDNALTANIGEFDGIIWTGSANEVTFTIGGTSGNRRIIAIEVEVAGKDLRVEKENVVEATCTTNESYDLVTYCDSCGQAIKVEHVEVEDSMLEHTYGDLVAEVPATCTTDGVIAHFVCSECGKIFNATKEEITEEDLVIKALGHNYVSIAQAPTCTAEGIKDNAYVCDHEGCGKYYLLVDGEYVEATAEEIKVPSEGTSHNYITVAAQAATCTEIGWEEYQQCTICGHKEGYVEIPAGHKMTKQEGLEETCTTDGYLAYYYCSACEKYFEEETGTTEITDVAAWKLADGKLVAHHTPVLVAATEATATTHGNKAYYTCSGCKKVFADEACTTETTVAANLLHYYEKKTNRVDATCSEFGYVEVWQECPVCGDKVDYIKTVLPVDVNAHNIVDGECTLCHNKFSKVLVAMTEADIKEGTEFVLHTSAYNWYAGSFNKTLFEGTADVADATRFTLKSSENEGKWYILVGDKYLNCDTSGGNKLSLGDTSYEWNVAISGGNIVITSAKATSHKIQYNDTTDHRFTNYSSSQKAIQAYIEEWVATVEITNIELTNTFKTSYSLGDDIVLTTSVTPVENTDELVYVSSDEAYLKNNNDGTFEIIKQDTEVKTVTITVMSKANSEVKTTKEITIAAKKAVTVTSAASNANCTVTINNVGAIYEGDTVTFTVAAADGYTLTKVMANENVLEANDGTYSFVCMSNTTITVSVQENASASLKTLVITAPASSSDNGTAYTATTMAKSSIDGDITPTYSNISKVYPGKDNSFKFGSSSAIGKFDIDLPDSVIIKKVTLNCMRYNTEAGNFDVTVGSTKLSLEKPATASDLVFEFDSVAASKITIATSAKRAYVYSITIEYVA